MRGNETEREWKRMNEMNENDWELERMRNEWNQRERGRTMKGKKWT